MTKFEITRKTFLNPDKILWIQSSINYSNVYLIDGTYITIALTLKNVESKLNSYGSYIRVNRSCSVNRKYIKQLLTYNNQMRVEIHNNHFFSVSRRKMKQLSLEING